MRLCAGERILRLEHILAERNELLSSANFRMIRDLQSAARVQQSLLPTTLPDVAAPQFAWALRPCVTSWLEDILNVMPIDHENIAFYLLDVAGHGVAAALVSVALSRVMTRTTTLVCFFERGQKTVWTTALCRLRTF